VLNYQQAKNNQLPGANGTVSEFFNFGRSLDPFTNTYVARNINYNSLGVNAGVTVFNGNLLKNTIAQNDLLVKANQLDMQAMKENISMQVVLAYLNILNAEDQLTIAQSQTAITKLQIERTEKLVRAGSLPQTNLLDLKAQVANEETTVVNNQSTLDLAKLNLVQLLNDKEFSNNVNLDRISVPTPSTTAYEAPVDQIYQTAEGTQPTVKASDLRVKSADKGIEIARAGFYQPSTFRLRRVPTSQMLKKSIK
jgi:outer membrane protein